MPIPKQRAGEHDEAFVSRCIGDLVGSGEYEQDQASAICYQQADIKLMTSKDYRSKMTQSPADMAKKMYKNK